MKKLTVLAGSGRTQPKASQGKVSPLTNPLSLIFSSVKVTASDSAEVTVSMTSEASKTSGKCDSGSHLSAPKLASAKYRQHRSSMPEVTVTSRNAINGLASAHMVGVCADNLLNRKTESAFVQAVGKEKGPAVSQALLSTSMISCTGESNELHRNLPLQATGDLSYSHSVAPQWAAGFSSLRVEADINRFKQRFFCVRDPRCAFIMVRRNGGAFALAGFFDASLLTPIRLATLFSSRRRGSTELVEEATTMATTQTRPEFIDTYWIIPEYETKPYGKVSFTRQDRRTFIAMFKDSRLIWAGRQPVGSATYGKHTRSHKVGVKRSATITEIVTVQGVAHV